MPSEPKPLTGLAIGDALGMPFETHPYMSEALQKWDGSFLSGESNTIQPERQPGEWTDDTKMALALAESLLDSQTYNPVIAASKYMEWYRSGDHRGIGKATREAMDRLLRGHHWNQCGVLHAQGNGAAMRAAPLGVYFRKSLITVGDMVRIDARVTHRDIEAAEGAVAVALAVAMLTEKVAPKNDLLRPILNLLHNDPESATVTMVETKLIALMEFLKGPVDVTKALKQLLDSGTGAHVVETVPAAFLCFLATENFKDAVELAVRAGGDCDTTAAITGAMAGAYYGEEQVLPYLGQLEQSSYLSHVDHLLYLSAPNIPEDL